MDSFYGAPRQPPTLPTINPIERSPLVPEVSIIDNSFFPSSRKSVDYNTVRPQQHTNKSLSRESFINFKKHVRFKGPHYEHTFGKENMPQTLKAAPDLNGKTFKQIYMANVPDRHLDLSIFESPRQSGSSMETNPQLLCDSSNKNNLDPPVQDNRNRETSLDFVQLNQQYDNFAKSKRNVTPTMCNTPSNDTTTLKSIENAVSDWRHHRNLLNTTNWEERFNVKQAHINKPPCMEICTQTEPPLNDKKCTDIATPTDEPTLKDLYRIIQQQNEQIMCLQRQVNNLKTTIRQPEIDEAHTDEPFLKDLNSPSKKGVFSFGVKATSVEFSFWPQQHKVRKGDFLEPKIQEIVECDSAAEKSNSLHLDGSLQMNNSYESNVPSIAIEIDEYQDSDDEEGKIGPTFYHNLMNQVNNALKQVQKNSECQGTPGQNPGQTMNAVKQATLQHLKNIGINLAPIQESSEVIGSRDIDVENCDKSDVSYAVQQLLMKYLPSDKLAEVMHKPKEPPRLREKKLKPSNTELSFATLQYMKKYNLIGNTDVDKKAPETAPKFLDVTALKLQRKFL